VAVDVCTVQAVVPVVRRLVLAAECDDTWCLARGSDQLLLFVTEF